MLFNRVNGKCQVSYFLCILTFFALDFIPKSDIIIVLGEGEENED
jgi:hypothetical protein